MAKDKNASDGDSKAQQHRVKGTEIFVGGLARSVTESMIQEMFSAYGEIVELRMMKDQSGALKGFCFVRFATKEAAFKARKEKDGIVVHGKKIGVSPSSEQDSLFFGNLRKDWSFEEFNKFVRQAFQDVVTVDLAIPPSSVDSAAGNKKLNRGFAIVQFTSHAAAARAYRLGSKPDFLLAGDWHPVIDWAEKETELDPEEMAKIKVAFVGNLPTNADDEFLQKLFEPFGKIERVALSRKGHFPVGFVHFADRSGLDKAIKEMDGKTVEGPQKSQTFKIQVAVAKPVEKDRKRGRDEGKTKTLGFGGRSDSLNTSHDHNSLDPNSKALRLSTLVSDAIDPYEAAVIALPATVKERLLRILRLGIATRYDIGIQDIASLKELPESAAIAVLDQFMLSGADKLDKGAYFASLVAKHQIEKLGLRYTSSHLPRMAADFASKESEVLSSRAPLRTQVIDRTIARYNNHTAAAGLSPYSSSLSDDPLRYRSSLGKFGEPVSYRAPLSSSLGYGVSTASGSSAQHPPERPQVRFDPFTGQPYKFDPFTGEPIQPEANPRRSANFLRP